MKIRTVIKDEFTVIGKMGQGSTENAAQWVPKLWENANKNFNEIKSIISYNKDGGIKGLWGIMSDLEERFERWSDSGKYLAGCETEKNIILPIGWIKWTVPAQTYILVACTTETYGDVINYIITDYTMKNNIKIIGAINEHYPEPGNPDNIELYFPIKRVK